MTDYLQKFRESPNCYGRDIYELVKLLAQVNAAESEQITDQLNAARWSYEDLQTQYDQIESAEGSSSEGLGQAYKADVAKLETLIQEIKNQLSAYSDKS